MVWSMLDCTFTTIDGRKRRITALLFTIDSKWNPLGSGLNGTGSLSMLCYQNRVLVYAGGYFTSAGGIAVADRRSLCQMEWHLPKFTSD